jgi:hypothetical protein
MEEWFDALGDLVGGRILHGRVGTEMLPRGGVVVEADFAPFDRIVEFVICVEERPRRILLDLPRRLELLALTRAHRWVRLAGIDQVVELEVALGVTAAAAG